MEFKYLYFFALVLPVWPAERDFSMNTILGEAPVTQAPTSRKEYSADRKREYHAAWRSKHRENINKVRRLRAQANEPGYALITDADMQRMARDLDVDLDVLKAACKKYKKDYRTADAFKSAPREKIIEAAGKFENVKRIKRDSAKNISQAKKT